MTASVRASSLNIALVCPGAPALLGRLSQEQKASGEALSAGSRVHALIQRAVETGEVDDEIAQIWAWIKTWAPVDLPGVRCEVEGLLELEGVQVTGHLDLLADVGDEVVVVDWKYGPSHRWYLPPIVDDLQMTAYGLMSGELAAGRPVRVQRALLTDELVEEMVLEPRQLESARRLVESVAQVVAEEPEKRTPGPHCDRCIARQGCPDRHQAVERLGAALIPWSGGELALTPDQALRWALARKPLEERVKALDSALRRALADGLVVEHEGQRLGLAGGQVETVADAGEALRLLGERIGEHAAGAVQTSKSAIEGAAKRAGLKKAQIDALLEELRGAGAIVSQQREPSLRWKRTA